MGVLADYLLDRAGRGAPGPKPKAKPRPRSETPAPESGADMVNHPPHYTSHPSGVECITITEHMGFCLGNAMKYVWRADLKQDAIGDLEKARWYIEREIAKRKGN